MNAGQIAIPKKLVYVVVAGLGVLIALALLASKFTGFDFGRSYTALGVGSVESTKLVAGSAEKFTFLAGKSGQRSIASSCGLQPVAVEAMADDGRIQGSCCSAMDLAHYQEQIQDLKKYANIPQIPTDPYDIPVSLAKQNFGYQQNIQLTAAQQATYDEGMKMSHDHAPCCCHCWRWIANEGLAKYLITEHNFDAAQITDVMNLVDGCGGPQDTGGT
jgi:hypothetical protein